jgi:hypothetical protein
MVAIKPMSYTMTPVDPREVPDQHYQEHQKSRYLEIDEAFLASEHAVVRLDLDWPEGATYGQIASVAASLTRFAKLHKLPLHVKVRRGDLYLERTDLPVLRVSDLLRG